MEEDTKPNAERLREYGDAGRASLERALYSPAPIYPEFEEAKLARSLAYWRRTTGASDPTVVRVLNNRTPEEAARDLVRGSKLADVAVRKGLVKAGREAVAACDDPMIRLARDIDAEARAVRKISEDEVEGVQTAQYALIARALFEDQGTSTYPDATFTLRLTFGAVKGYAPEGRPVASYTTIGGAFEHAAAHGNVEPYALPASWFEARDAGRLQMATALNLVTTCDTIGGNSGSPVIDRSGAVIGLNFDRNRYGLARDFGYDDRYGRNIAVDVRAITERSAPSTARTSCSGSCAGADNREWTDQVHGSISTTRPLSTSWNVGSSVSRSTMAKVRDESTTGMETTEPGLMTSPSSHRNHIGLCVWPTTRRLQSRSNR